MVQRGNPKTRAAYVQQLRGLIQHRQDAEALRAAEALPPKLKSDPELLFLHATALERAKRWRDAIARAERSLKTAPHPNTHMLIARCHRFLGETDDALRALDRADAMKPGLEQTALQRSAVLEAAGRFDDATAVLRVLVDHCEASGTPMSPALRVEWSKLLVQNKALDEAVELIEGTLETPQLPPATRARQLFLMAKAHDRNGAYELAAAAATRANEIGKPPFDPAVYSGQVDTLVTNWTREKMATYPMSTCESLVPVFVAGMPRSGTSLVDQIIDAHPKASGVGELDTIEQFANKLSQAYDPQKPEGKRFGSLDSFRWTRTANDYVKQVTKLAPGGTERVANKALGNNKLVGLLARLFPNMRVIHVIRDPRDVAISCYMGNFNNAAHPWTAQIDWTVHAWRESMRMMEHWRASIDAPILDVHYENLVADPQREFPRLIEFLGLAWDDRCYDFHTSTRTVRTLSYDQVNRPLYTTSAGRHKNYASLIEGVEFPAYDPSASS